MRCSFTLPLLALSLLALLLVQGAAHACLNDRDTLAEEIKGLPDVVQVVTGRFERDPPLYYQMRLARVAAGLKAAPDLLPEYDDAGVACDRLGRDAEAIAWMDRKRARLVRLNVTDPAVKEQWYRYNANVGTFWVHRWIRAGADRRRIGEVRKARGYIAEAIKINPNAHFGREKYQLRVMDWIIKGRPYISEAARDKAEQGALDAGERGDVDSVDLNSAGPPDPALAAALGTEPAEASGETKALCGLITLGSAWESVDVFQALGDSIPFEGGSKLYPLVKQRCDELIDSGHRSLIPGSPSGDALKDSITVGEMAPSSANDNGGAYRRLRAEADDWQKKRSDYMMARLTAGRHPDTDPTFWNEYRDAGPPAFADSWQHQYYRRHSVAGESESGFFFNLIFEATLFGFVLLLGSLITWRVRVRRKRQPAKTV